MFARKRSQPAPASNVRRRRIRKLRLAALLLILLLLGVASFSFGLITAVAGQIPNCDPRQVPHEVDGHIYANDDHTILATLRGSESRILVDTNEIAPIMQQAIVSIEDKRFYEHHGVDLRGIARAVWADVTNKKVVQGGSTITQQLVKNSCVTTARTISRKLKEAALAWQLEQHWRKLRILTAYLNTIYFGNGAYGIQRAAQTYFDTSASRLTLAQAALLAGVPADPSRYDPVTNPKAARARRLEVLKAMLAQGDITRLDVRRAAREPLPRAENVHLPGIEGPAPYFVNYVKQQLIEKYGTRRVFGGGLNVQTTIDLRLQKLARKAIQSVLKEPNGPSAALVAVRPSTGEILAMYGGDNFRQSQFNLAVQGERQPGSSFKPFVLATALKEGISPATTFPSKPVNIFIGDKYWPVHNYENDYIGSGDLTTATIVSDNSIFAQLTRLVGPANVAKTAHQLGITRHLNPYFAIGLGADAVSPLEMARAFSTFANSGRRVDGSVFGNRPRAIARVNNAHSQLIDNNRPVDRAVLTPDEDALLTSILEGVIRSGTGKGAALPDRVAAGKTGTTENYGDAWFVGYTPQLATAVWVGYPNKLQPMLTEYHGQAVAGGTFPAEIWRVFTQLALAGTTADSFPNYSYEYSTSRRVVWRDGRLQLDNGYCRETALVSYFAGRGPSHTANCKRNEVEIPRVIGMTLAGAKLRLAGQPLTPNVVYKPARPKQRVDLVVDQFPRRGRASSYDTVTLVLAKPLHGVVPNVIGLSLRQARARLRGRGLVIGIARFADGGAGQVLAQIPVAGVAAAPRMTVSLIVGHG
ncbi:MAG: PBP1A family penicillin-binding protein [Actinobacteria bacterium]|nr:MAG: PBP1A family penicillin-binding protein [Actinomycetota bacterium]